MFGYVQMCWEQPRGVTRNARNAKVQRGPGGYVDVADDAKDQHAKTGLGGHRTAVG